MRSLAEELSMVSLAGMMDKESIAEEFSIGSLAEIVDKESSREIQYWKTGRYDRGGI
jgi:hypothetical protein